MYHFSIKINENFFFFIEKLSLSGRVFSGELKL